MPKLGWNPGDAAFAGCAWTVNPFFGSYSDLAAGTPIGSPDAIIDDLIVTFPAAAGTLYVLQGAGTILTVCMAGTASQQFSPIGGIRGTVAGGTITAKTSGTVDVSLYATWHV